MEIILTEQGEESVQENEREGKRPVKTVMQISNIMYSNKNPFKLQGALKA